MDRAHVNECVVEVGPATVRGPCPVAQDMMATALACIDDEVAVLHDAPVAVAAIWRELFRTVLPEGTEAAVLVCPTWWPQARVERVREAAATGPVKVSVRQRAEVLGRGAGDTAVVEIAPDFVVTALSGDVVAADPRIGEAADIARTVAGHIGPSSTVVVDAPVGVAGAVELAAAISECLRIDGAAVMTVDQGQVLRSDRDPQMRPHVVGPQQFRGEKPALLAALVVSATLVCLGLAFGLDEPNPAAIPTTLLVEGRVALKVPALWTVRRITSGQGSARVQVMAPDESIALLVTQSTVREGETLSTTSAALSNALADQQEGVFSRFSPDDRRAGRPAATYRELREGRQIDWAVFVDGSLRIAVGCQSAPGAEEVVRHACEEAVRSAHAVF